MSAAFDLPPAPRIVEVLDPALGLEAYLAVDSLRGGLAFGGLRIDPTVTRSTIAALARRMSLKLSVHGAPVGGAKAGLRGAPDDPRLPAWLESFAHRCADELLERTVLGKDMGAADCTIGKLYGALGVDQLFALRQRNSGCARRINQLNGYRRHMTGLGIAWSIAAVLGHRIRGSRVLIQGVGAVGAGAAVRLARLGASVVGVSDRQRAFHHAAGLPPHALIAARNEHNEIEPNWLAAPHRLLARDELLTREADVLVLAAGSNLVDRSVAASIRCPVVIEGANIGLRPEAQDELHRRGITVVPDVIANSTSAALVGHQLATRNAMARSTVWRRIRAAIEEAVEATLARSRECAISTHQACADLYHLSHA